MTAEQKARDLLERMGMDGAQSMTAGDLCELANLISDYRNINKDGYCKQHHPETRKARDDALRKKYEEEANNKREILERKKRIIAANKRIIEATKRIVLNTTLPPPEHEGFVFTLEEDFMELMNAYLEYEKIT